MLDGVLRLIFPFPFKIIAYADDLTVITSHREPMQATLNLQKACDTIGLWLKGVKLSLNAVKSSFVIFHRFRATLLPLSLVIDGVTMEFRLVRSAYRKKSKVYGPSNGR